MKFKRDPLDKHLRWPHCIDIAANDNRFPWGCGYDEMRTFRVRPAEPLDWQGFAAGIDAIMRRVESVERREPPGGL